ncbi:hypothetical protein [Streptomyces sp. ICBB 8177]|uniref:hypothetical protein n=1 Tax=Streptomyces sp. ICBB 8177 TaxID=563922 RepID=UPI000D683A24|nr:hypothetical protein [Streptomyces sp. ICBB 8177]PWI42998.1 hypothetical protein CK485_12220 [Streptomyces sp. ICBB 8177]
MRGARTTSWLGLTPEPERELPSAVAALRAQAAGPLGTSEPDESAERRRVEQLVLHGTQRGWLRYLAEVTALVTDVATGAAPGDPDTALLVADVVLEHHRMLIGLPGPGYRLAETQRSALTQAVRTLGQRPEGRKTP